MTEDERKMLREMHTQMAELRQALFDPPAGAGEDEHPLIHDIRTVVRAYKRASWVTRALMWLLPTVAGLGVAGKEISRWFLPKGP